MTADTFTGLRPVAKKLLGGDFNHKTRRIVLPSSSNDEPVPRPVVEPPWVAPTLKPAVKKRYSLVPVSPPLLELLPQGILLTPGWIFIGSNPSLQLAAFTALVLNLDGISKVHAAVTEFNHMPFVTDMGSTNGTRVFRNEKAIEITGEPAELQPNDVLWIGSVFFNVVQT